jgi:hypothetical protein
MLLSAKLEWRPLLTPQMGPSLSDTLFPVAMSQNAFGRLRLEAAEARQRPSFIELQHDCANIPD